jgi:hypothetical protein
MSKAHSVNDFPARFAASRKVARSSADTRPSCICGVGPPWGGRPTGRFGASGLFFIRRISCVDSYSSVDRISVSTQTNRVNTKEMQMIKSGEEVKIKPEWQDPGDDKITWIAVVDLPIKPTQVVKVEWLERIG